MEYIKTVVIEKKESIDRLIIQITIEDCNSPTEIELLKKIQKEAHHQIKMAEEFKKKTEMLKKSLGESKRNSFIYKRIAAIDNEKKKELTKEKQSAKPIIKKNEKNKKENVKNNDDDDNDDDVESTNEEEDKQNNLKTNDKNKKTLKTQINDDDDDETSETDDENNDDESNEEEDEEDDNEDDDVDDDSSDSEKIIKKRKTDTAVNVDQNISITKKIRNSNVNSGKKRQNNTKLVILVCNFTEKCCKFFDIDAFGSALAPLVL